MTRPIVAVDLDEVLGQFVVSLTTFHNEKYGTELKLEHFHSYRFCEVWGGTDDETMNKVHDFFESSHFEDLPLVPGALQVLSELKDKVDFVVVTSRQHVIEERTREWLARHYPGIFRDVLFGNHYGFSGQKRSKPDMCAEVGATILIDDSLIYATQCAQHGIKVLLFDWEGRYMWSKSKDPEPDGVLRVHSWDDIRQQLGKLLHIQTDSSATEIPSAVQELQGEVVPVAQLEALHHSLHPSQTE
mmetsp:Transcript_23730/g.40866  ORF Transcript_23730/g.40866 Transcript_23730/m.40866 type:complete len:244 (+) Transcript_23730:37-768(+)